MKKILIVCGPTSTGKTKVAIKLAKILDGELISADSRQVYKNMDIGTGKDIPKNAKLKKSFLNKYGYYDFDGVKLWGYDLANPKSDFSVAQYLRIANKIIKDVIKRNHLPIVVGGTGLYIKGIVDGIPTAEVPRNNLLRANFETKSALELYEILAGFDSIKAASMNASDRKNPRRLIRAIEVAQYQLTKRKLPENKFIANNFDVLQVGLKAPSNFIEKRIIARVDQRVNIGIKKEIQDLIKKGVNWENQSMASLGYGVWRDYFEGAVDEKHIINEWILDEKKYAKRQMIWFKKDLRIKWFDITDSNYLKNLEKLVKRWHNKNP